MSNWDGKHFLYIAQHGYVFEHSAAFFPLFPLLVNLFARYFITFLFSTHLDAHLPYLLSAVVLNFILFQVSCVYLVKLTRILFNNNEKLAYFTLILYCLNPASIFYSSLYSECLYSTLTFAALFYLFNDQYLLSFVLFILNGFCRSNAYVNLGFIVFYLVRCYFDNYKHKELSVRVLWRYLVGERLTDSLVLLIKVALSSVAMFIPFALYQYYIYTVFCTSSHHTSTALEEYARDNEYRLASDSNKGSWCYNKLPLSYTYIQSEYWKVGFMRYWQLKQIPNFLLALPVVYLSLVAVRDLFSSFSNQRVFNLFGLIGTSKLKTKTFSNNYSLIPFAIQAIFLVIVAVFFMHVQVRGKLKKIEVECLFYKT